MSWYLIDGSAPEAPRCFVPGGTYRMERIDNPLGYSHDPWLVIAGTKIGASELYLKLMSDHGWGDFQLILDEAEVKKDAVGVSRGA